MLQEVIVEYNLQPWHDSGSGVLLLKKSDETLFYIKEKQNLRAQQNQAAHHIMALPFMTGSFFLDHKKWWKMNLIKKQIQPREYN
jgi:hypothetical protein